MIKPQLLQLLLLDVRRRVVRKVRGLPLKLIDSGELDLLVTARVECLEGWSVGGTFCLAESSCHVRKSDGAGACLRGTLRALRDVLALRERYIVDRSKLCCHQAVLLMLLFLQYGQLMVFILDYSLGICEFLSECFMFIGLDTLTRGRYIGVVCALRRMWVLDCHQFLGCLVENYMSTIHGLVILVNSVRVAKCRVHLLLDDGLHTVG